MEDVETETMSLLDKVLEVSGLEREDDELTEVFKARIVRWASDQYPNTDDGNAAFEELDEDVQTWINDSTKVVKANKSARTAQRLPELDGLEEDPAPAKGGKSNKAEVKKKTEKVAKEKTEKVAKEKGAGRGVGARKELAETFEAAPEDCKVSKKIAGPLRRAGFKREADRSKAGHIVFKHEDGREIHVGPGKGETVYLMGWRPKGQSKHNYGGPELEAYLEKQPAA